MPKSEQGLPATPDRYTAIPRVLVFVFNGDDVLLLKGAPTKRIWANRYNGLGGHVEAHEDVYAAARREIGEESGLSVTDLRLRGVVNVDIGRPTGIMLFVFTARSAIRETKASEEGTLEWVPLRQLPQENLVKDIPALLARIASMDEQAAPFFARYWYDEQENLQVSFAQEPDEACA
ncbi:MAG: NUDIX domain-containing protein [Anaerolineae bacterium]|nr:NUDIX domain-containing protein [Anaerolineae bacterium]